jgi:predicted nucleic acid-binding protein
VSLIADSGALYAVYDADDAHHAGVCEALAKERGAVIVPVAILAELDYLLREFLGIDAELDFLDSVSRGAFSLEPLTATDIDRCRELIAQYRDLDLGLADAAIIATAERLGIKRILTVDERDFRAVRPRKGTFTLLPSDDRNG